MSDRLDTPQQSTMAPYYQTVGEEFRGRPVRAFLITQELRDQTQLIAIETVRFLYDSFKHVRPYYKNGTTPEIAEFNNNQPRKELKSKFYAKFNGYIVEQGIGGSTPKPLGSLAAFALPVECHSLSIDRLAGYKNRWDEQKMKDFDVAAHFSYPHDINHQEFGRTDPGVRVAVSNRGILNGNWGINAGQDGHIYDISEGSTEQGFVERYTRAYVSGLGNMALLLEAINELDIAKAHSKEPISTENYLETIKHLADRWLSLNGHRRLDENGGRVLALYADQPLAPGYDIMTRQLGQAKTIPRDLTNFMDHIRASRRISEK